MITREIFERKHTIDLERLPKIKVPGSRLRNTPNSKELREIEAIIDNDPGLIGLERKYKKCYGLHWVRLGASPEEVEFTHGLRRASRETIDDLFRFLDTPQLTKPSMEFIAPVSAKELIYQSRLPIRVYFVPDFGIVDICIFEFTKGERREEKPFYKVTEPHGTLLRHIHAEKKANQLEVRSYPSYPIFIRTSSSPEFLVEAAPMEALHKSVGTYTTQQMLQRAFSMPSIDPVGVSNVFRDYIGMEERFVHAMSALWLKDFSRRIKILTEEEVNRRLQYYISDRLYIGTIELSRFIESVGIAKAVQRYVADAPGMFKDSGIKLS